MKKGMCHEEGRSGDFETVRDDGGRRARSGKSDVVGRRAKNVRRAALYETALRSGRGRHEARAGLWKTHAGLANADRTFSRPARRNAAGHTRRESEKPGRYCAASSA